MNKVLLTVILYLSFILSSQAQVEFTFGSDTLSSPGGMIDVDVNVNGFQDLVSMQLSINWDPSVYSFESIENVTDELPAFSVNNIGTPETAVAVVSDGELTMSWSDPSTLPASIADGTRLFTIRLSGVGDLCSSTTMTISNTPRAIEVVDADFNILDVTSSGGNLDIYDPTCPPNGGGGGGGDNLSISLENASAASGSSICIPVVVDNFTNILSFQSGVTWDPSILRFTGINEEGLQSVTVNDGQADQGELRVLWFFDQEAVTLADGSTIFELCFDVVGNTGGTTSISLVNLPGFNVEVSDEVGTLSNIDISNSIFTVGSGGGGGMQNGVGLIADDIFTNGANSICIAVTTRNFDGVAAFQTGISFDPSILTYTGIMDGALEGTDVGTGNVAAGELRILWQTDISTPSVTLDDDVVLFELCFDVIGNDGDRSEIGFVTLPNFAIEFSSEIGLALEFFLDDGSITIGTEMSTSEVVITAGDVTVNRGSTACVDFTVTDFTNIQGMGFAIEWDESVVSFVEAREFNLTALSSQNFSLSPSADNRVRVLWTPTSSQTVANGTSIFQMCFEAVDECGASSSSAISFVADATPIEIIDGNNNVLDAMLNNGTVSIANCSGSGDLSIIILSETDPTCNGSTNGVVSVDFENASGTVMCLWANEDGLNLTANCNLIGFGAGTYTLTATDQGNNTATATVTLNEPSEIVIDGTVVDATCTSLGQITLNISGGTSANGTYGIEWNGGLEPNAVQSDLQAGTYRVTVTDDNGCQEVRDFVIENESFGGLNPMVTNITDPDMPNGSIDLNPDSGTNFSYSWSTGATTSSISDLDAGTYTVTVTDQSSDCTQELSFTVDAGFVSGDMLITTIISRYNGFGVSCFGEADGLLDGDIIGGCSQGEVMVFLDGSEVTLPVMGIAAGDHTLRLVDACGNMFEESFTLEEPDQITSEVVEINCPISGNDGQVTLNISGGTGAYSISSSVGNQSGANTLENLPLGTFTIVIQDENGCQVMTDVEIDGTNCTPVSPDACIGRSIITPNGDNVNDVFVIGCTTNNGSQPNSLTVFDRWGNLVREFGNYDNSWDGTDASGDPLPEGGYMWVLTTGGAGNRDLFRGTVSILR